MFRLKYVKPSSGEIRVTNKSHNVYHVKPLSVEVLRYSWDINFTLLISLDISSPLCS